MKFTAKEDVDAPIEAVYARLTNFEQYERQALRRGASVRRLTSGEPQPGTSWDIAFTFRGKERRLHAELVELDEPNAIRLNSVASGINGDTQVDLVPLSPRTTRVSVVIELSAKSLSSRLMLQSLKLARGTLQGRLEKRMAAMAEDVATRYRAGV